MKIDSPGRWQFMSISARMVKKSWNATQWHYCGQPLRRVCRWALHYWQRDISCRTGRCAGQLLAGESRLYLWFYYRHYGPPAIIYRKHRDCGTTRHAKPTMSNVGLLMRLWGVVLLGNILGTGIAAWAFEYMPIFNEETRDAFVKIGMDVMKNTPARCLPTRSFPAG